MPLLSDEERIQGMLESGLLGPMAKRWIINKLYGYRFNPRSDNSEMAPKMYGSTDPEEMWLYHQALGIPMPAGRLWNEPGTLDRIPETVGPFLKQQPTPQY